MEANKTTLGIFAGLCAGAVAAAFFLFAGQQPGAQQPLLMSPAPLTAAAYVPEPVAAAPVPAPVPVPVAAPAPSPRVVSRPSPRPAAARQAPIARAASVATPAPVASARPARAAEDVVASRVEEPRHEPEPRFVEPVEPPLPVAVELMVPADSVVGLQVETSTTSERARVEDPVSARITRDVRVSDRVAIPAGSVAHGVVTLVERGGRLRERARLGVRFTSVVLPNGTRLPIDTDTIYREGDSPGGESAAKIGGGAIGGAIIGGLLGGAKGAVVGGSIGAGAGTAAVYTGGRNAATLPSGTPLTVRLLEPVVVTVDY